MGSPFIGEIRMVGFNFAPQNWAFCDGSAMVIAENEALFSLLGTTYGGDGVETYNLPDLRGRRFVHQGTDRSGSPWVLGEIAGEETHTLTTQELPSHAHLPVASTFNGTTSSPVGAVWARASGAVLPYGGSPNITMSANLIDPTGGNQPHENMPPFLVINFIISLFGIFPSRN
jgi:microcystin-dependent protein